MPAAGCEEPWPSDSRSGSTATSRFQERLAKNTLFFNFVSTHVRLLPRGGRRFRSSGDDIAARQRLSIEGRERDESVAREPIGPEMRARRSLSVAGRSG